MNIWFDITNTPQVHFLLAIERLLRENNISFESIYTARDFSETVKLLEKRVGEDNFYTIGGHYGKSYSKKIIGLFRRFKEIYHLPIDYEVSLSCGSENAVWKSFLQRKNSIAFGDNDLARQWTYGRFVNFAFFPNAIDKHKLEKQGLKNKLYLYDGYKEDLYLGFYTPDDTFLSTLPFDNYVVVRPENINANYIRNSAVTTITPMLLKELGKKGYNVLYLPRYEMDREYADGIKNIYVPNGPINGLDACYYSDAVLTGAGTFAREAACLGVPSFSFFAGSDLLAVDKKMIRDGWMFFSRDVDELMKHVVHSERKGADLKRSVCVQAEVGHKLKELFNVWGY